MRMQPAGKTGRRDIGNLLGQGLCAAYQFVSALNLVGECLVDRHRGLDKGVLVGLVDFHACGLDLVHQFVVGGFTFRQLERFAGELACVRASDEEIEGLVELHERMMKCYSKRDRMPYYKLNQEFHSRLAELSKNETLKEMQSNIQGRLKRIRYIGSQKPDSWDGAVADHEEMVLALKDRDGQRLGEAMASHLLKTWERVKDSI